MKKIKKTVKKSNCRMLAAALVLTGVCGTLFYGISGTVLAAELGKEEKIPTTYAKPLQVNASKTGETTGSHTNEANYQIIDDPLNYENDKVTENELSKEEAAAIGVSFLCELYDIEVDGTYVYMGYLSGTETMPRAFWSGDIRFTGEKRKAEDTCYNFTLDAVTGEVFTAAVSKQLDVKVSLDYDAALAKEHGEYADIAMQFVKDKGLLKTEPVSVEYSGQGYQGNDPDIAFIVNSAEGEKVTVNLSRYDKRFKGVIMQAYFSVTENMFGE